MAIKGKVIHGNTKPGIARSIEIACKRLSWKALRVLEAALEDEKIEMKVRIQAAQEVMNRGWGRPKQSIDATVNVGGGDALLAAITEAKKRASEAQELPAPIEEKEVNPTYN